MNRFTSLLLSMMVLLTGCAGTDMYVPAQESIPQAETAQTEQEWPTLCTHPECYEEQEKDGIVLQMSEQRYPRTHTCNGESGTAIFIDGVQVGYKTYVAYNNNAFFRRRSFAGREIAEIDLPVEPGDGYHGWNMIHIYDIATLQEIELPDVEADVSKIRYDAQNGKLDMRAFPEDVLLDDCAYQTMPQSAKLNPHCDWPDRESWWLLEDALNVTRCLPFPYGIIEVAYVYENGEFVLSKIWEKNGDIYPYYEPVWGKVLEMRERTVDDGLLLSVTEAGTEVLLGGERMDYFPEKWLDETCDDVYVWPAGSLLRIWFFSWEEGYEYNMETFEKEPWEYD